MSGVKDKNVFSFLKNKSNKKERTVQFDRSHKDNDNSTESSQEAADCKQKRSTPERRESGRFPSAARILRSLGRGGDDSHKHRGKENVGSGIDRKNPQYHSEGKGLRKKLPSNDSASGTSKERSHSFCEKETQKKISKDKFSCESPIMELPSATNSPKAVRIRTNGNVSNLSDTHLYEPKHEPFNSENIYEHVSNPGDDALENPNAFPVGVNSVRLTMPGAFEREKDRRSSRKLTKDSGCETSPYSESDYANMELAGDDLSHPKVSEEFRVGTNAAIIQNGLNGGNLSENHPKEIFEKLHCHLSPEVRSKSEILKEYCFSSTAPAPYAESISSLCTSRSRSPLPKFPSVENLGIFPETLVPNPGGVSLVPARSTPSLCQLTIPSKIPYKEVKNGSKLLSSKSTPNLEERKNESMVTNRSFNPAGYTIDNSHSHNPPEMYYDRDLGRRDSVGQRDYANHLRSSSYQILHSRQSSNGYHSRQHSNASTYSDDTITGDVSLSQSHNISSGVPDKNGQCHINSEANYFVRWEHPGQEIGYLLPDESSYYASSQINFSPSTQPISTDHNFSSDKNIVNSSKLHPSPPPPPVRDASSLKYIRYGPGHEKFPSWPVPAGAVNQVLSHQHIHDATLSIIPDSSLLGLPQGCHRSHSWTEQSDYPKNNCGGYTRPHMKNNLNPNFQSQLLTVMENCEKIPPEMFHPKHPEDIFNHHGDMPIQAYPENMVYCPPYDREGRPIDDKDYNIPSPPERDPGMGDVNLCHFTSAQLEEHARLYDLNYEEFPHITPFLDQLRNESYMWDEHSERDSGRGESESVADSRFSNGRDSVTTVVTNSSSASSSETLKWHGSFSDISIVSGNSRESKRDPNVAHSSRVKAPQRQNSESVLYYETEARGKSTKLSESKMSREQYKNYRDTESGYLRSNKDGKWIRDIENTDCTANLKKFPSYSYSQPLSQISESPAAESIEINHLSYSCPKSPTIDFSKPPSVADRISELEKHSQSSGIFDETKSPGNCSNMKDRPAYSESRRPSFSCKSGAQNQSDQYLANSSIIHEQEPIHTRPLKLPVRSISISRRDAEDFPISSDKYNISPSERRPINSAYTYLDPKKKCMVSDSTLKNIQKQALLSFYERKTGKGSSNSSYQESQNSSTSHSTISHNGKLSTSNARSEGHTHSNENMARIGKVPTDSEASSKLHYKNSFSNCRDDNNMENSVVHSIIDLSSCPQTIMPEIHTDQWMPSSDHNSSSIAQDAEEERRDQYSINHSPSSSNLQLKGENVTTSLPTQDSSPRPPDRPPKNPSLLSTFANKSKKFDEVELSNGDYKNIQRKPYYYNKPPAPDPPSSPEETAILPENLPLPYLNMVKNQVSRAPTPDLPPPPPPPEDEPVAVCDEPLPPPPSDISFEKIPQEAICEEDTTSEDQKAYHKDSYMAHRKDWTTGFEGRYRRTHSPSAPSQRNLQLVRPRDNESSMNFRNLQRSGIPSRIISSSGESAQMRSSVSTSNLSPVCDVSGENDVINNNNLCQTSRNLAQSADWSSHNTSITVNFSSDELKAFKAKKANLQLSAFKKYNAKDSRQHHPRDVSGSVQSLASSSEASQSSTPSDESRYSSSWKTSLDSLNRPPSGMSEFSCHMRPISRAISVGEPLHRLESQDASNRSVNLSEPLQIITTNDDKYESGNKSYSSPVHLSRLSINGEAPVNHDGPVTAHPATVTEDSQPSSPISLRDHMNATSTPKTSPDNSPKSSLSCPISPNSLVNSFLTPSKTSQSPVRSTKDTPMKSLSSSIHNTSNSAVSPNNSVLSSSVMQYDRTVDPVRTTNSSASYLRLLSPTGTSCSMAATVIPDGHHIERSNIVTLSYGRKASKEEIDYDKQSVEFISCCNYDKKLKTILAPGKDHKTIASYMENLFALELRKDLLCSSHLKHPDLRSSQNLLSSNFKNNAVNSRASIPIDTTYLTVSDCKARLLAKVMSSSGNSPMDAQSHGIRKESLINSLRSKLHILKEEQGTVKNEISTNSDLGLRVTDIIQNRAKTAEFNRYKLHVEEIDKIISLLLVLSGRLAKAENGLSFFTENSSDIEKKTLESKRDKLREQLDEAKKLKESIDRRAIQVSKFLVQYLNESEFAEYDHYVKMKAKLFMDSREIDEKVRLGEEQLQTLQSASL